MSTIPQRLREIATKADYAAQVHERRSVADSLRTIAAELEAPAADAVPVVAYEFEHTYGKSTFHAADEFHLAYRDTASDIRQLIRQRDHLATVAALQARINELEARQVPDGSAPITQQKLADMIQEGFMAGAKRGIETAVKDMLAKGWVPPQSSQQDAGKVQI